MVIRKIINSTQKILTTSFKNLKRVLTGEEKILVLSFKSLLTSFTFLVLCFSINIFSFDNVFAEDLDYNITIQPSLNLTTSATDIKLNLNPATNPFSSKDLTVSVGTNNETGYKLYISSINNTTNLIEENDNNLYIETLSEEYDESSFPSNRWGYKLNSTNDKYIPFTTGNILVSSSETAVNNISKTLIFAAKAGYETKPGTYNLALKFEAVANPIIPYIQDYDKTACATEAIDNSVTVLDKRDNNEYQVRYINGNCWMVQNLRFTGAELSSNTSNVEEIYTDTNPYKINNGNGWVDLTAGNSYDEARLHDSGDTVKGVWYNYAGASAGTITGSSNSNTSVYSVCPKNWKIPTKDEKDSVISYRTAYFNGVTFSNDGLWNNGSISSANFSAYWWTATASGGTTHYYNGYRYWDGYFGGGYDGTRYWGFYLRCIRSN